MNAYIDTSKNPHREMRSMIKRHLNNLGRYVEIAVPLAEVRGVVCTGASYRAQCFARKIEELEAEQARNESREVDSLLSEKVATLQFQIDTLTNVDTNRIRRCPVCHRLYWVRRADAGACSDKCNTRFRGYNAFKTRQIKGLASASHAIERQPQQME